MVDVRIKWPNDVYGPQGVKIGGVLCESTYSMTEKTFNVTVGAIPPTHAPRSQPSLAGEREQERRQRQIHHPVEFPSVFLWDGFCTNAK